MEFRVLGPTELWSAGQPCDLGSARARSVLAILLLTPRTIVPANALIDRLWETDPPPKARESLSVYVARVRASLRQAVGEGVRLAGRANGYVLDVDPEAVDLHQFRRLRRQAGALTASGDYEQAAHLLREADGLWHGQALAGIRGDWVARMRDSLEDERRAVILERVECELELGRHADLVSELRGLLAQYPLDETFIAHQMTALYRSGRPGDALSLYRETRGRLADEQGTEPGPMLAGLHQRILRHDPELSVRCADRRPRLTPAADMHPHETAERAGNGRELALPAGEHGRTPQVVVLGSRADPPAIQLTAAGFAPGDPSRPAGLPGELSRPAAGLGGSGAVNPEVMAAFDLSYRALEADDQRFLRRLGVSPCTRISLHAAAALGGCTPAEAEKGVTTLLDHHLLVEDPAGQFRFHDLIRECAAARAANDDPAPERRKAVRRLLDYYLDSADRADQVLHPFRHRMPVSVTHPLAASPLGTQEEAAGWLESEWRNVLQAARHAGRHEWKRQCADLTHVLAGFVETRSYWDEAIEAHTLALQACRDLADPARIARASLDLSMVSQQTGRGEAALALAADAAQIYRSLDDRRGQAAALDQMGLAHQRAARSREAFAYFHEARTLYGEAEDPHGVADTLCHSGIACWQLGRHSEAADHLREALSLYRAVGDRRGEAKALNNLGKTQLYCGYHKDALESYHESLKILTEMGAAQSQAVVHHNIGSVHFYKGSYEESLAAFRRALVIYRAIGDLPDEVDALNDIGAVYQCVEYCDEALIHYEQARLLAEEIGNLSQQVTALRGIADVRRGSGRYRAALEHYHAALRLAREIGDPYEEAKLLEGIAETTLSTQGPYAARIVFRQALDIYQRLGVPEAESARIRMDATDPAPGRRTS